MRRLFRSRIRPGGKHGMRLVTRIAVAVVVLVPLLVLSAGTVLFQLVVKDQRQQRDQQLRDRARTLAPQAEAVLKATTRPNRDAVETQRLSQLYRVVLDDGIRLIMPDDEIFQQGPQPALDVPLPKTARKPVTVGDGGHHWRAVSVPVAINQKSVTGTLWVFTSEDEVRRREQDLRRRVFWVALMAVPLSAAAGFVVAERATKSLRQLRGRAAGLDPSKDATRDVHVPTGVKEVDELGRTIDTVLGRYDEQAARTAAALDTARSFAAVAAHELRTPLTSMRTNLDVLERHADLDPVDRAEILTDLGAEHARVLGLLRDLGALAQGDLIGPEAFGPVDVTSVAHAAAAAARGEFPRGEVAVEAPADASATVHGWETGLRMAVDNLVRNAMVHGGDGTRVRVAVEPGVPDTHAPGAGPGRTGVLVTVDDDGPGIPAELRGVVFERFRRGAASPGSGLGLTLVAQQAALHGGTVVLGDVPGGAGRGLRVRLWLPAEPPASSSTERGEWLTGTGPGPQGFHKNRR
ncbi:sensor histidine kinase [Yinghuangia seranimata]|uniref:sensor histidine kinase n=1 Tax=Yinghuangia seranimata TaxID=408067 RepID=UPI00248C3712|nr:HAMP domain-containing sensor histidine kinase [Yinghuangia seranimata]MDI2132232.1 HAMP domain-containing sensor histidine kinase [Yinghuangia seranimata]